MRAGPPSAAQSSLDGVLERVLFRSDDERFVVAVVTPDGAREPIRAVGELGGLQVGERVRLIGSPRLDPKHGPQFRVVAGYPLLPQTREAVETWLGSGQVKTIGPKLAARLVAWFGEKTLDVIIKDPERLEEVEGIGPKRRREIAEQVRSRAHLRDAVMFLQSLRVPAGLTRRIMERYEERTIPTVRANPYILAEEVRGIGFQSADQIARALGFDESHPARCAAGLAHLLIRAGEDGHVYLPRSVLTSRAESLLGAAAEVEAVLDDCIAESRLIAEALPEDGGDAAALEDPAIYLPAVWRGEAELAERVQALLAVEVPALAVNVPRFEARTGLRLAPAQRAAVELAAEAPLMVLTGGPGTGKTTIVKAVLHHLQAEGPVALAAPTGRAARRMAEATNSEASTLHRLLGYHPSKGFSVNEDEPLQTHAVIVDEASMVDQSLALALLRALEPGTRLILVGDADQLPSVGAGNVLADLLGSDRVPRVRLTEIFRQAEQSRIVTEAHRVLQGHAPRAPASSDGSDFFLVRVSDPERAATVIETMVAERIERRFGFDPVDDVQVLTPMHRGVCGAQQLNRRLQARLNPHGQPLERGGRTFRVGDKVMQVRNDYQNEVFNGDLGRVIAAADKGLVVRFDGRSIEFTGETLNNLVLAYACSVHKSQGSEYPAVVVPVLTEHWVMLQRNLLYTAITRGRKLVVLVGQPKALWQAARNVEGMQRFTGLRHRLEWIE